jgi:hypothetical protein
MDQYYQLKELGGGKLINNIGQTSKILTNGSNHQCKTRLIVSIDIIGISPLINQLKI